MDKHVRRLHHQESEFGYANRIRVAVPDLHYPRPFSRRRISIRVVTLFDTIVVDVSRYTANTRDLEVAWDAAPPVTTQSLYEVLDSEIQVLSAHSDTAIYDSIHGIIMGDDGEAKRGED
jgi:hypothetical protein